MALPNEPQHLPLLAWCLCWQLSSTTSPSNPQKCFFLLFCFFFFQKDQCVMRVKTVRKRVPMRHCQGRADKLQIHVITTNLFYFIESGTCCWSSHRNKQIKMFCLKLQYHSFFSAGMGFITPPEQRSESALLPGFGNIPAPSCDYSTSSDALKGNDFGFCCCRSGRARGFSFPAAQRGC